MGTGGEGKCRQLLVALVWVLCACIGNVQAAETCRAVFSGGLQTHGAGTLTFQWGGQLLDNPNTLLDTVRVQNPWGASSCGSQNCQASGLAAASLGPLAFPDVTAQHDLRVNYLGVGEAGGNELNRYRAIELDAGSTLSFNPRHQAYYIQRLRLAYGAKVTLAPGRYWIGQLDMASNSQLRVAGGTAKVMVATAVTLPFQARINGGDDGSGRAEALQLFVRGNLAQESASSINALAYASGDYRAASAARLNGALSAQNVDIGTSARVETNMAAIGTLGWNAQCQERGDLDGDGILDLFDEDTDGDGFDDERERVAGSDPRNAQSVPATPPPATQPNLCVAAFAQGLQTHGDDGRISFAFNAQLRDAPSAYLPAMRVDNSYSVTTRSCGTHDCQAAFTSAVVPSMPAFLKTTDGFRQDIAFTGNAVFDGARKEWARLSVGGMARARFATSGVYRLRELEVGYRGTLELAPGDYWVERLTLGSEARLLPIGNGTVRLHVLGNLELPWQAQINATGHEQPGDASRMLVLAQGNVTLASNATLAGFVYARGNLIQQYGSLLYGGAVARNVSLETLARTHHDPLGLAKVDFGLLCDLDGDGIGDNQDPDRDGDGISNEYEEQLGTDPDDPNSVPPDMDGDGVPDALDDDRDGDGVPNDQDAFPDDPNESRDLDGDGIGDNADPDRDGDGISNEYEIQLGTDPDDPASVPADLDGDGIPDALDDDRDGDGVPNDQDAFPDDPSESRDLDGDGIGDNADPDRDGDGISNEYEIQLGTDPDDPASVPADLDGDGIPDALDDDRDGDGVPNDQDAFPDDPSESRDLDGDGIGDNADPDRDGDDISNEYEIQLGTDPDDPTSVPADLDGDGIPDALDDDRDGDGVPNDQDAFPDDPNESRDLDGDGIGDNADPDRDGDGISNEYEIQLGTDPDDPASVPADLDGDGIPDALDDDRDGDGVPNDQDAFPDDPNESRDLDGDGIGDNADPDRDGDGVPNDQDAFPDDPSESRDLDGDGIGDNADPDRDGDGISNEYEIQLGTDPDDPASVPVDLDGDGIPDALDDDRDGDGVPNDQDAFPNDPSESRDLDGDGIGDNADSDRDGDGISNEYEIQLGTDPDDPTSVPSDLDGDGIPDALDDDRDGDDVPNDQDAFPDDPSESRDLDGDGIGDNADPDRDGDGISNEYEIQLGTDPDDPASVPSDLDGDGIPDALDDDRDGDGVPNDQDAFPDDPNESHDLDGDGIGDNADPDRDGDGISNEYEIQMGTDPDDPTSVPADLDGDGIPDALDDDLDGDGVPNDQDAFPDDPNESRDLDGDGIGDNADPDRDGDGVSNEDEIAAGTDPDDASDFPDRLAPEISIDGPTVISVNEDSVSFTGSASDAGSGIDRLEFLSDRYPGVRFAVTLQNGNWVASVPVQEGSNLLTLVAYDKAGNSAQLLRTVERLPRVTDIALGVDYPQQGAILQSDSLVVRGTLRSDNRAQRLEVLVNGQAATLTPTAQVTEFAYQSAPISLQPGSNTLSIQAWVEQRSIQRSVQVTYQPPQASLKPPRFDNLSPVNGSLLPAEGFMLTGQVFAEAGLERISVNGRAVALREIGQQVLDLREALNVPAGRTSFSVELLARDRNGQETRQNLVWQLDKDAPQIILDQPLVELPAENRVSEQPFPVSGTLRESNPASFQVNGNDVPLQPGSQPGEFRFATRVSLPLGQATTLTLEVRDQAGNRLTREYGVELSAQAGIAWVLPTESTELLNLGQPIDLQVAARVEDLSGLLVPRAILLSSSGDTLSDALLVGDTSLKSSTLQVPAVSGEYRLLAVMQDASQRVVAQSSRSIRVVSPEQVPVALERMAPADGERGVEPNDFIGLYFNQAIELAQLQVRVFETAHGKTYVDLDELGTDEINAKGHQLVDVNRDFRPVAGRLSELPGSQVVAFYPEADLAYGAEITVEVVYSGEELDRMRYYTRALPTLVTGTVTDQLGQPAVNVEVRIEELARSVRTNRDGGFSFGFGDSAEKNIAGGRYQLQLNPGLTNKTYGGGSRAITLQQGVLNEIGYLQLPQLSSELPYVPLRGGEPFSLLQGELKLDLSRATLQFPDGRQQGDVHVQMLPFTELPFPVDPMAMPFWMYSIQPGGIRIEGEIDVDLAALPLGDSFDYLPENGGHVVMVGVDQSAGRIVPVGVGVIDNFRIRNVGRLVLDNLDMIGFALVGMEAQPALQAYAAGDLSLRQLQAELYSVIKALQAAQGQ